jgi:pentatricopeptide repeat protein
VTIGTLLAALAIAGCGGGDDDKISEKSKKEFISGCSQAGQPEKGCECIFDELKKQGIDTKKKFENLAKDIKKGQISDKFREAALSCKDELQAQ